jgi:hypothetical protein
MKKTHQAKHQKWGNANLVIILVCAIRDDISSKDPALNELTQQGMDCLEVHYRER